MILDLNKLLAPIEGDSESGEDLRYDVLYDEIKELRREDDNYLPQGVWETDIKRADWKEVKKLCIAAITDRTKDLQITAWLLEALIHCDGFEGFVAGVELINGLCEKYWDSLYPELTDDDVEFRISPVNWINEVLSEKIKIIPITEAKKPEDPAYSFLDYQDITQKEKIAKQSPSALKEYEAHEKLTMRLYEKSKEGSSREFYENSISTISEINLSLKVLESFLDKSCGENWSGLGRLKKNLVEIATHLGNASPRSLPVEEEETAAAGGEADNINQGGMTTGNKNVRTKHDAYRVLGDIADYLLEIDPHSPVPYLVKRAVSWGEMDLRELLTELMKDGQDIQQIYSLLGIHNFSTS